MKSFCMSASLAAVALWSAQALAADIAPPQYKIVKEVPLGAPERWDYVVFDPVLSRVYVAHGDRVTVIDATNDTVMGDIEGMAGGTHGIASVHALGKGFTDDGKAGFVVVFDLKTLKVIDRIKAEPDADGIVYDAQSGHILVIDGDSAKVTVIDPATDKVIATIDGGGGLEFGVSGGNGKFYVDGEAKHEIVRIDLKTNLADAHWPMPACLKPHGLAIDRAHMRLFASCGNGIMTVLNAETGAVLADLPIGQGTDFAEFDAARGLAFSSNRDGTLSIVAEKSPDSFVVLPAAKTEPGARTMAVDSKTGRIYLVTADMTENPGVSETDYHHRYTIKPGSVRLLVMEPIR